MTPRLDDGPILAQRAMVLTDDDDGDTIVPWVFATAPVALRAALERIAAGDAGTPQREEEATAAPRFAEGWRYLDWSRPARDLHLQVRSWLGTRDAPRGAIGMIDGVRTRVLKTRLTDGVGAGATPGTLRQRGVRRPSSSAATGPLLILRHHPEPAR